MKKKNLVLLVTACVIIALGFALSHLLNWPIDTSETKGDIAKSSRFSRKTVDEGVSNMQELLANDEEYKNNLVLAYTVMQVRANQFDALVDLSVEAAGDKKEFESVLADMKAAKPMIKNVCSSMVSAADDLDAALGGEKRDDLAQNTNNAALAYTVLQKQNELADRFIEIADNYAKNSSASDLLKFTRDQWVEYQIMTAALNQDEKTVAKLEKEGSLFPAGSIGAIFTTLSFDNQISLVNGMGLCQSFGLKLDPEVFGYATDVLNNALSLSQAIDLTSNVNLTSTVNQTSNVNLTSVVNQTSNVNHTSNVNLTSTVNRAATVNYGSVLFMEGRMNLQQALNVAFSELNLSTSISEVSGVDNGLSHSLVINHLANLNHEINGLSLSAGMK